VTQQPVCSSAASPGADDLCRGLVSPVVSTTESSATEVGASDDIAGATDGIRTLRIELALFVVATTVAAALLVPGHFWGDDWTLYVRQADALLHGRVHQVIDDVTFTARNSTMREFTPEGYPWGTPVLLTIPLALFGHSIAAMKITMALSFGLAVAGWYALGRRWVGPSAALGAVALLTVSLPLASWTNLIASDIPYLAVVGLTALTFARTTTGGTASLRCAVGLGAMSALAFAFRQEGLAVLASVVVAFAVFRWSASRSTGDTDWQRVLAWLRPTVRDAGATMVTFLVLTSLVRVLLPSQLLPRYSTAGLGRLRPNLSFFDRSIATQLGVYDPVSARVEAFGSPSLGWVLIGVLVISAVAGVWTLGKRHSPLDVMMLAIAGSHAYGALTFPFPDTRYMFVPVAVTCFVVACGIDSLARKLATRPMIGAAVLGLLVVNQVSPYVTAAHNAATARRIDRPAFSPFEPEPQQMFAVVRDRTAADDVIAFSAARAMTYFTDRRAVQVRNQDEIPVVADWIVVELALDGATTPPPGFAEVWRNDRYVLLRVDHAGS
jgi:4-amino-4-deoxy-L-arabinose transferase-like glycosyltransferase